jgi:trimeric autotransporter adhesin
MIRSARIFVLVTWLAATTGAQTINTIAGTNWTFPGTPLPAIQAPIGNIQSTAVDAAGNIYIADPSNNQVFKVDTSGNLTVFAGTGVAGYSGDNGPATSAQLSEPEGVAVDASGDVFIADSNNLVVREVSGGTITTAAGNGQYGYSGDGGPATSAMLTVPYGIAVTAAGNLLIVDAFNYRIRQVAGGVISTVAGNGTPGYSGDGGPAIGAELSSYFVGVAADAAGNFYIADSDNSVIRKVNTSGIISTIAGTAGTFGYSGDNGPATAASLNFPGGVAVDAAGNVYIADTDNNRIRKVVTSGTISTVAGNGIQGYAGDNGPATSASLDVPGGITVDAAGDMLIADTYSEHIRKVIPAGTITTVAGNGAYRYAGDGGPATNAALNHPNDIAVDNSGDVLIADLLNERVREVSNNGTIATVAGNGIAGFSGDNGLATSASLFYPGWLAIDGSGNLYIADEANYRVRKVNPAGTITTVAGNGVYGYSGDNGPATSASMSEPAGLAVDAGGNLYIADIYNHVVRKVDTSGTITTIAGNGTEGHSGDGGPATSASFESPVGLAVDASGNLFISDEGYPVVRKVTTGGIIWTVAGNGKYGYSGDNGPATSATLSTPIGVAVDALGNLFIADAGNSDVREVAGGVITTVAGNGTFGFSGDGGAPTSAALSSPHAVTLDAAGNLYIADQGNERIREVTGLPKSGVPGDFNGTGHTDVVWQDPATGQSQVWYLSGALGTTLTGAADISGSNTWRIVGTADFNQDGHPDLLWQDPATGESQVWFLGGPQGTTILSAATFSGANPWRIVAVADFNGDGHPDVVWQDPNSGTAQIWYLGGAQGITVQSAADVSAANPWHIAGCGDFNGDGYPDLLWQDPVSGTTQVWYLGGAQGNTFMSAADLSGPNPWRVVGVADLNQDGHPDVIWQDPTTGNSQVWYLTGPLGTTILSVSTLSGANTWRIVGQ